MNKLKITGILILSVLIFSVWNTAEARFFIKSDTLDIGDEAPQFVMRDLITNNAVFLRDYTGKTLREEWKKKKIIWAPPLLHMLGNSSPFGKKPIRRNTEFRIGSAERIRY